MKKIAAILGMLLTGVLLVVVPTAPANAYDGAETCWKYDGGDVTTCIQAHWVKQSDGTGVRLEGWRLSTNGCNHLEGTPYKNTQLGWINPKTDKGTWFQFGNENCNVYKDMERAGRDNGGMDFRFATTAAVNFGGDRRLLAGFRLKPGGGWTLLYKENVSP